MKKILCLILSLTLLVSSLSIGVFADGGNDKMNFNFDLSKLVTDKINEIDFKKALENFNFNGDIPDDCKTPEGQYDIEKLVTSGTASNVYMFGLSIDFLYNSEETLLWTKLPASGDPYCTNCKKAFKADAVPNKTCPDCGKTLKIDTIYNDMALACGNLNFCLKKIFNKYYEGNKLYTAANATKICNIIGHLLFTNYTDQNIGFDIPLVEDNEENVNLFYDTIAEKSGLKELIQKNWCNSPRLNYKPLLYTLGVNFEDFPAPERDIYDAKYVSRILLSSIISSVMSFGPVNYLLDVIWAFSRTYAIFLYEPIKALFSVKISSGLIQEDELKTFKGLLNLIFNNNNSADTSKLQFITPPSRRFATSVDTTELFLYVIIYLNLVGKNGNNPAVIENIKSNINSNSMFDDNDKQYLVSIVDGLFCGNLNELVPMLANYFFENISDIKDTLWQKFVKMIKNFIKNFVGVFDKIYKNFKNIGNWMK